MKLRKAETEDKKSVLELINFLRLDIPNFVWGKEDFIDKQINNGEYFLSEENGEATGIISLRQRGKKMYIETLVVPEKHRLRGVGTRFIEFAKSYTKEKGLKILCACSFYEYNAVDFYSKLGFHLLEDSGEYNKHKFHRFELEIKEQ